LQIRVSLSESAGLSTKINERFLDMKNWSRAIGKI